MPDQRYCEQCGAPLSVGLRFCEQCGSRVAVAANSSRDEAKGAVPATEAGVVAPRSISLPAPTPRETATPLLRRRAAALVLLIVLASAAGWWMLRESQEATKPLPASSQPNDAADGIEVATRSPQALPEDTALADDVVDPTLAAARLRQQQAFDTYTRITLGEIDGDIDAAKAAAKAAAAELEAAERAAAHRRRVAECRYVGNSGRELRYCGFDADRDPLMDAGPPAVCVGQTVRAGCSPHADPRCRACHRWFLV